MYFQRLHSGQRGLLIRITVNIRFQLFTEYPLGLPQKSEESNPERKLFQSMLPASIPCSKL